MSPSRPLGTIHFDIWEKTVVNNENNVYTAGDWAMWHINWFILRGQTDAIPSHEVGSISLARHEYGVLISWFRWTIGASCDHSNTHASQCAFTKNAFIFARFAPDTTITPQIMLKNKWNKRKRFVISLFRSWFSICTHNERGVHSMHSYASWESHEQTEEEQIRAAD